MSNKLWGEINDESEIDKSIANLKPASMFIPKPYSFTGIHDDTPDHPFLRPPLSQKGINTVLHAIDLVKHNNEINVQKTQLYNRIMKTKGECEIPEIHPPPDEFCPHLSEISKPSESTIIRLVDVPAISKQTANVLLKKSAASILCHVGFATAHSDALDCMTEVFGDYIHSFCLELRKQQDSYLMGKKTTYTDVFEATLYENKIRGYDEFIKYVKSHIIEYTLKLDDRRQEIEAEYSVLCKIPKQSARSIPGHFPAVNSIDLLKGDFGPEPASPSIIPDHNDAISRDVFMHEPNGIFYN